MFRVLIIKPRRAKTDGGGRAGCRCRRRWFSRWLEGQTKRGRGGWTTLSAGRNLRQSGRDKRRLEWPSHVALEIYHSASSRAHALPHCRCPIPAERATVSLKYSSRGRHTGSRAIYRVLCTYVHTHARTPTHTYRHIRTYITRHSYGRDGAHVH